MLQQYGFVVINLFDEKECENLLNGFVLEANSPLTKPSRKNEVRGKQGRKKRKNKQPKIRKKDRVPRPSGTRT